MEHSGRREEAEAPPPGAAGAANAGGEAPAAPAPQLRRNLQSRHIQMAALGGALGTGLFYGSGEAIAIAGPAILLSYLIGGCFIYLVLRMLGEMSVEEPVAGSFSYFAYRYWGGFAGFFAGWNYWFMFVVVGIAELTVIGIYLDYWLALPHWQVALTVLAAVTAVNLAAVRFFGEFEFGFSLIKVLAVLAMIILGLALLFAGRAGPQAHISNLWAHGGFFPHGWGGALLALTVVMFSFGGSELIGITAAEAERPELALPKAIRQFSARILLFYLGATAVILILSPWDAGKAGQSPFVAVFGAIGIPAAADILNIVVIAAAISVLNSGCYADGRMLLSLAGQGNAPACFKRLNGRGAPYLGVLFSSACIAAGLGLNYAIPGGAFMRILAVVTTAVAASWAMIILVQLRFRRARRRQAGAVAGPQAGLQFPAPFYPLSNYLCLGFLGLLFALMLLTGFTEQGLLSRAFGLPPLIGLNVPDVSISALIVPLWICLLYGCFRLKKRRGFAQKNHQDGGAL